jgi:hypothetical protein
MDLDPGGLKTYGTGSATLVVGTVLEGEMPKLAKLAGRLGGWSQVRSVNFFTYLVSRNTSVIKNILDFIETWKLMRVVKCASLPRNWTITNS